MTAAASSASKGRYAASGAVAGSVSTVLFAVIHDIFISDIWFSLVPMLAAGALCGLCVAWSYALLVSAPSPGSWLRYNLLYVAMFALLGALSGLLFEPVTTMAAVVSANGPPDALIGQALPLTAAFTVGMATLVTLLYRAFAESCESEALAVQVETPQALPPLPAAVEVAAYHIGREGLANVVRHAQARRCTLRLWIEGGGNGRLHLAVQDDGRGIASNTRAGVGLTAMRERAEELGGTLTVHGTPGQGTQVTALLPLNGGEEQSTSHGP